MLSPSLDITVGDRAAAVAMIFVNKGLEDFEVYVEITAKCIKDRSERLTEFELLLEKK